MRIELRESKRKFTDEQIAELRRLLSILPASQVSAVGHIGRVVSISGGNVVADGSPFAEGKEIRLTDLFYTKPERERAFIFYHEMCHNYSDWHDRSRGWDAYQGLDTSDHEQLLRVQWMRIGQWGIDPAKWRELQEQRPELDIGPDPLVYTVRFRNPNLGNGEWTCEDRFRIPKHQIVRAFRYEWKNYSPREELADAYAMHLLNDEHLRLCAGVNPVVRAKYEFVAGLLREERPKEIVGLVKMA